MYSRCIIPQQYDVSRLIAGYVARINTFSVYWIDNSVPVFYSEGLKLNPNRNPTWEIYIFTVSLLISKDISAAEPDHTSVRLSFEFTSVFDMFGW